MPAPSVRRAVPGDGPRLRALQRHLDEPAPALLDAALDGLVGECYVALGDGDDAATGPDAGPPVGYLLAVEGDGGVDGGVGAVGSPGPFDASSLPDDAPTVHVAELVVAPDARRRGHASALLGTLLARHPAATVTLTVAPDNDAARALYDRFGFAVSRTLPDRFADGPGLLLVRRPGTE